MELTDLEIKSKLAIIEGHVIEHIANEVVFVFDGNLSDVTGVDEYINYNPLKDDALCFQLMVKYRVTLDYDKNKFVANTLEGFLNMQEESARYDSANKAICLAIIEAHNK